MGWRSGQSYSQDLRDRVLKAVDGGVPVRQAAATFQVSIAYIYKALIRRRVTGDARINPSRGHAPRKLSGEQELALAAHMRSRPGITLAQAQAWLLAEYGVELSTGAVWNAARRLGLSFKKSARAAEQDRPDVAARRKLWRAAQPFLDPESLVFLDETGVNTKMARLYGWSPVGERCRDKAPFGHWKTMTFVAGLRLTGMTAPWVLDRAMDGDAFRTYVQHVLAPTLKPGDVLVLDNLPAHKVAGIREAIAARHAQIFYLPPYSPDMNPIEMAFSKLKALLRQEPARSVDALVKHIGSLLDRFHPNECANFFHAAGYQRSS
ncbi:IS630 family transposase [Sphingobium sp. AntQ-1]|uniref:IS630 family transposase n=1 Tax=Sphingobium sp. AntQ-1 TaxID=2930091 RepID=UPI00234EC68F|nr:IS630 family transposase [Sphingobium sp. AntQ-1]